MKKYQVKTVEAVEITDSKGNIVSKERVVRTKTVDVPGSKKSSTKAIEAPKKHEHGHHKKHKH